MEIDIPTLEKEVDELIEDLNNSKNDFKRFKSMTLRYSVGCLILEKQSKLQQKKKEIEKALSELGREIRLLAIDMNLVRQLGKDDRFDELNIKYNSLQAKKQKLEELKKRIEDND